MALCKGRWGTSLVVCQVIHMRVGAYCEIYSWQAFLLATKEMLQWLSVGPLTLKLWAITDNGNTQHQLQYPVKCSCQMFVIIWHLSFVLSKSGSALGFRICKVMQVFFSCVQDPHDAKIELGRHHPKLQAPQYTIWGKCYRATSIAWPDLRQAAGCQTSLSAPLILSSLLYLRSGRSAGTWKKS